MAAPFGSPASKRGYAAVPRLHIQAGGPAAAPGQRLAAPAATGAQEEQRGLHAAAHGPHMNMQMHMQMQMMTAGQPAGTYTGGVHPLTPVSEGCSSIMMSNLSYGRVDEADALRRFGAVQVRLATVCSRAAAHLLTRTWRYFHFLGRCLK